MSIHVPRKSARPKRSRQKVSAARVKRDSILEVRYTSFQLNPPPYFSDKDPIDIWIVHALEKDPPAGSKAIEWLRSK